jgi:hypothetical protein
MLTPHATPSTEALLTCDRPRSPRRWLVAIALSLLVLGGLGWAAFAPIELASRDELFEIPQGTWARRMAGEKVEILPDDPADTRPQRRAAAEERGRCAADLRPALIMPAQSFRLPFATASTYNFACTAHASGQRNVIVEPTPARGWETLRWRLLRLMSRVGWHPHTTD